MEENETQWKNFKKVSPTRAVVKREKLETG